MNITNSVHTATVLIISLPHLKELPLPAYATTHSAGMDLIAALEDTLMLEPFMRTAVPTGIAIALPDGHEAQVRSRSSLALKHGIAVVNSPGTIDADYRGEILVPLINLGNQNFVIKRGMRIAQIIISRYTTIKWDIVKELPNSQRGEGGFGSTGSGVKI
ncbi:Deoxyuridine 5'-triphosphate nucleotidohydrolase [Alphaproteobacteria bacterium]